MARPTEYTEITYIYRLCCPRTKLPVYVGKSDRPENRLNQHISDSKRRHSKLHKWIKSLGEKPILQIVMAVPASDWESAESRVIAYHRERYDMLNVADGGNAPKIHGITYDKRLHELKKRMAQDIKGGYVRESTKEKLRQLACRLPHMFGEYRSI